MDEDYNLKSTLGLPTEYELIVQRNQAREAGKALGSDEGLVENGGETWEDLLGTGVILKKILVPGTAGPLDREAPRRFFAFIDIETRLYNSEEILDSESHKKIAISVASDLFSAVTLVIPLMNIGEVSKFMIKPKFAYGAIGNMPHIPPESTLVSEIKLLSRYGGEEYIRDCLPKMKMQDRLSIAQRKRERGNFWFCREQLVEAIESYKSSVLHLEEVMTDNDLTRYGTLENVDEERENEEDRTKRKIANAMLSCKNNLAACYIKREEYQKAFAAVDRALEINPSNIKSLYRKYTVESKMGKYLEAQATLDRILELDPENKMAKLSSDQLNLRRRKQSEDEKNMCKRMFGPDIRSSGGLAGGSRLNKAVHSYGGQSTRLGKYIVVGAAMIAVVGAILFTQSDLVSKYF